MPTTDVTLGRGSDTPLGINATDYPLRMQLGHQVRQALTIKHERIAWFPSIRGATVVAALVSIALATGHESAALYLGIGSLFAGIATINDPTVSRRAEGILIALSLALGTLLGSLLAPYAGWNVFTIGVLSVIAGFGACMGRRAALVGTVFIANYAVNVGLPHPPGSILPATLMMLIGALVQVTAIEVWDITRRRQLDPAAPVAQTPSALLRSHLTARDPFVWHAIRLAIAEVIAMTLGTLLGIDHGYWIPLTVAFILLPDTLGTATQVIGRIVGTFAGLAVLVIAINAGFVGRWQAVVAVGIGALLSYALGQENYAFSVAGITISILVLDSFVGQSILTNVPLRFECTLLAAGITISVWLFTSPWKRWITSAQPPTPTMR